MVLEHTVAEQRRRQKNDTAQHQRFHLSYGLRYKSREWRIRYVSCWEYTERSACCCVVSSGHTQFAVAPRTAPYVIAWTDCRAEHVTSSTTYNQTRNSWAHARATPAVDITAMTSSGHLTPSVTSPSWFDSAWPRDGRQLSWVNELRTLLRTFSVHVTLNARSIMPNAPFIVLQTVSLVKSGEWLLRLS